MLCFVVGVVSAPVFYAANGRPLPPDKPVAHIFAFVCLMATVVANKRGGRNSQYIRECADFMAEVVGRKLSIRDPLPAEYDWRPSAAVECAEAMMEYDS